MRLELLVRLRVRGTDHRAKRQDEGSDSTVLWALNSVTQAILEKLFATTPPMVQAKLAVARPLAVRTPVGLREAPACSARHPLPPARGDLHLS
ncbi:hypothetical protein GWO52_09035 [Corynebacterium macginleyi]|uniref:hypothetical protein n=1 Tax=Corynebacterium macginleyi TaxID=38290 RepID=UPI00190A75F5|nr:hypothetical protein [Corynebacterium macginleyi]MBK4138537.1 hypothetical protein [Corynebacterium macginleyi]